MISFVYVDSAAPRSRRRYQIGTTAPTLCPAPGMPGSKGGLFKLSSRQTRKSGHRPRPYQGRRRLTGDLGGKGSVPDAAGAHVLPPPVAPRSAADGGQSWPLGGLSPRSPLRFAVRGRASRPPGAQYLP